MKKLKNINTWDTHITSASGYIIREEIKRAKMRSKAGIKTGWNFKKRAREDSGEELFRECMKEMRERIGRGRELLGWELERKDCFGDRGINVKEMERKRREIEELWKRIEESEKSFQKKERWKRIRNARYNILVWYKWVKEDRVP